MGCTTTQRTEQVLEAMKFYFGARHCRIITFANDDSGDQSGKYFDLNSISELYAEKKYYVLLTDGTAVDPAPAGKTKIEVEYDQDDTAADQAELAKLAIEATGEFLCAVVDGKLHVENKFLGAISAESYAQAAGIEMELGKTGFGGELGAVAQGGGSLNTEQSLEDLTSDQTGDIILDQIIKGASVSMDLTLLEMTQEKWEALIANAYGSKVGDAVGYGTDKLYRSSFEFAGMLVGHPIRLPMTNRSADVVIWKTTPNMNSINFSGSEVQGAEFSFVALRDTSKPEAINLFARGDHSLI